MKTLSYGSTKAVYWIYGIHSCLVYVRETGRSFRSQMNGHIASVQNKRRSPLHGHFHQPNHSVVDMREQIVEKDYCSSYQAKLSGPFRRNWEQFWIKKLGTDKPYGFND